MTATPTSAADEPIFAIDLGKTTTRLDVVGSTLSQRVEGPGARLGDGAAGIRAVQDALDAVLSQAEADGRTGLPVVAGIAGSLMLPSARADLARWLARRVAAPAAVTSDIVLAHIGALDGEPGVCLVAGTGAVALGVSSTGDWKVVDGWGPDIGDLGGGSWIGREGVRAVLNAVDRGGPATALLDRLDEVRRLVGEAVGEPGNAARTLARFAPAVLDAASAGDAVAAAIVGEAVAELATTAVGAAFDDVKVAVLGGLAGHEAFAEALRERLSEGGLLPTRPLGTATAGALLVHRAQGLVLEGCVERADS